MGDGSTERDAKLRDHFRGQAKACDTLGSPFTAMVCRAAANVLDRTTAVGAAVLDWPGTLRDDAVSLRFCGALHALVLSGADADLAAVYPPNTTSEQALQTLLPGVLARHADRILAALTSAPQTNEVARCGMLLPGFLQIARATRLPLAIREIGSSAGLNLFFDRYHYRYGEAAWGNEGTPVRLAPEVRGALPPLGGALSVASRGGCDINPVDLTDPAARLRLRSYVWPDQALRFQRIDAAIAVALESGLTLRRQDAAAFVAEQLAKPSPGLARVLSHSIMWQYMPEATRREIEGLMVEFGQAATQSAPLAWLRMEPLTTRDPHATLLLTLWPGGQARTLANCDYHGRWIEWTAG
jgi:hypothetical protein